MPIPRHVIFYFWFAIVFVMLWLSWATSLSTAAGHMWPEQRAVDQLVNTTPFTSPSINQLFLPWVVGPLPGRIVIAAAHIDSAISGEGDEAILLWNIGEGAQPLAGWQLATTTRQATFPITSTLSLAPGERLWCAAAAVTFRLSFGEAPSCEWASDSEPAVLNLDGKLALTNSGGHLYLRNVAGEVMDTLIYGDNTQPAVGWQGVAAQLYARGDVPTAGQVWQRKRDPIAGWPLDTDQASDWAGDLADPLWGRQVRMPGWSGWTPTELDRPASGTANASVTIAVGPEGLYQPLAALLTSATLSLDLSLYTLEHRELAQIIADAARRGVQVRLLLEGSPPGGISDLQKWGVAEIAAAGGQVRYLAVVADAPNGYRPRYRFLHAKYGIIDGQRIFNGTENFNQESTETRLLYHS